LLLYDVFTEVYVCGALVDMDVLMAGLCDKKTRLGLQSLET